MKKILFIFIAIQSTFLIAQNQPEATKYNAADVAGIFYYQEDKVVKKIKVKKDNEIYKAKKLLKAYNNKVKNISFLNSQKFNDLNLLVNSLGPKAKTDQELRLEIQSKIDAVIIPVRDSILNQEKELNKQFENFLSKKQLKRWKKYQKKEKLKTLNNGKEVKYLRPPNLNQGRRDLRNRGIY